MAGMHQEKGTLSLLTMLQQCAAAVIRTSAEAEVLEKIAQERQQRAWLHITLRASEVRFLSLCVQTQDRFCSARFLILKHHGVTEYFGIDNQETWRSVRHVPTSVIGRQVWSRLYWLYAVLSTWHDTSSIPLLEEEENIVHRHCLSCRFDSKNTEKMPKS